MNRTVLIGTLALVAGIALGALGSRALNAQPGPVRSVDILTTDLIDVEGKQAQVFVVELDPGAVVRRHFHPGHEFGYVLEGDIVLEMDGQPDVTLKTGELLHVPTRVVHGGRNPSATAPARILVFEVLQKGEPPLTRVP
jgi:quercetin dioxygenase-like cupin family protein